MPDHTIAENLTRLQTARTNIATAITTKGGTVAAGAGFEDFSTAIGTIPAGGGDDSFAKLIDRSITSAVIPSGVTKIGDYAFYNCRSITSVTIPNTVTVIEQYAFAYSTLESVTVPGSVTTIGPHAFSTSFVKSIVLQTGVQTLSNHAFYYCCRARSLSIPSTVTSIAGYAFDYCSSLDTITFEGSAPPTVAPGNWTSLPTSCTIRVPTGSLTAYTTANNYPDPNTYTYVEY